MNNFFARILAAAKLQSKVLVEWNLSKRYHVSNHDIIKVLTSGIRRAKYKNGKNKGNNTRNYYVGMRMGKRGKIRTKNKNGIE